MLIVAAKQGLGLQSYDCKIQIGPWVRSTKNGHSPTRTVPYNGTAEGGDRTSFGVLSGRRQGPSTSDPTRPTRLREVADGEAADREATDGEVADREVADGEATDGKPARILRNRAANVLRQELSMTTGTQKSTTWHPWNHVDGNVLLSAARRTRGPEK